MNNAITEAIILSVGNDKPETRQNRDFIRVGKSRIQGKGVFAKRKIPKGTRIIEYQGERISVTNLFAELKEGKQASIYSFGLSRDTVIDGARNGNDARFFNHSCQPNCEVYIFDERVYIYAMREIVKGEELTFDYHLGPAFKKSKSKMKPEDFPCFCGSANCRGTMLYIKPPKVK